MAKHPNKSMRPVSLNRKSREVKYKISMIPGIIIEWLVKPQNNITPLPICKKEKQTKVIALHKG